jgi:hypothetical protein
MVGGGALVNILGMNREFPRVRIVTIAGAQKSTLMGIAYLVITGTLAGTLLGSGLGKLRHNPHIVKIIHEVIGVPFQYFPALAACEFAGAAGLVLGIWSPAVGVAAAIGLVIYFVGAVAAHLRVGDVRGIGPAVFLLALSAGVLILRILTHRTA